MTDDYDNLTIKGISDEKHWVEYWDSNKELPPKIVRRYFDTDAEATEFYNELIRDK